MAEVEPGAWEVSVHLQPGEYRFRYVTDDGRWFTDYASFGVVRNDFGAWDSVVYVPEANEVTKPNRGENTLTAKEVSRLSVWMALVWCFTRKGDSVCGDEDDLSENPSRTTATDRDRAVPARGMDALGTGHTNTAKQSQSLNEVSPGMALPKRKEQNCLVDAGGRGLWAASGMQFRSTRSMSH